jgi:bifunctional non-homologous end joining protein LigD
MGLAEYQNKRDFRKTPEPRGGGGRRARQGLVYAVQKHAASSLHYDVRLEWDGVLVSFAVPKGPSLDPHEKRLAVHVEDHPLEYADFEGVIPQGEYGGGAVMLWDRGTWEPKEEDVGKALEQGTLHATIHGERLRGAWLFIRMEQASDSRHDNWLMRKKQDEHAREGDPDGVLEAHPASVVSGRRMKEIAQNRERVWSGESGEFELDPSGVTGGRKASLPDDPRPELATLEDAPPRGEQWLHEIKYDGYRILAVKDGAEVQLMTRGGKDWTERFGNVAAQIGRLPLDTAVIDGEMVALDEEGLSDFQALQNAMKKGTERIYFYAFDALHLAGYDLAGAPLEERKVLLRRVFDVMPEDTPLRYSDHVLGQGEAFHAEACARGLEGIISKRRDAGYRQKRTTDWRKIKCVHRQEFVIGGFTPPGGSRKRFGALLLGYYEGGELRYAGRVGSGFTESMLEEIGDKLETRERTTSPFADELPRKDRREARFVRPELVGEVAFTEWTEEGSLRHPAFQGLREDKTARDVRRERPAGKGARGSGSGTDTHQNHSGKASSQEASMRGVKISNADKVLYPDMGVTKGDLAGYYDRVAEAMLPWVENRALTLVRCPDGWQEECFYQKHLDGPPKQVRVVEIEEKKGVGSYAAVDRPAGILALLQLGVLEFHVWGSRTDKVDAPDLVVFDLDPGEGVGFEAVREGARAVRMLLEDELGLTTFLRATGGKGLHVLVPVRRRHDWDEVREFAHAVSSTMAGADPDRYIDQASKDKRKGKVYVDYLRNARGATAIANYSTRARKGVPVAAPLRWDELATLEAPNQYTIENMPRRLSQLKSDPWEGWGEVNQSITRKIRDKLGI